jgi:hypothetical protein
MTRNEVGVYFLGDDGVYRWALGLLRSLRTVAPDLTVYCLPFSQRIDRLAQLERRYQFAILNDPSLDELDEIGRDVFRRMVPQPDLGLAGTFRKLFTFWGPLDRYFYTDADVILLDGFVELFLAVTADVPGLRYAHSDIEQAYRPGHLRNTMMSEYSTHAINTGLWASRRGVLTLPQVRVLAAQAESVAQEFCSTLEQPFLNYCLDVRRVPMRQFGVNGLDCAWAGDSRLRIELLENGRYRARWPDGSLATAIHWAGYKLSRWIPYYRAYRHFGHAAMSPQERRGLFGRELFEMVGGHFACRVLDRITRTFRKRPLNH